MKKYSSIELYDLVYKKLDLITTDTRSLKQGSIFLTLKGDRFNGNHFIEEALKIGAEFVIADELDKLNDKVLLVENAYQSLCDLALIHRKKLNTRIIALTGTNGKTTTKEILAHIFKTKFNTLATQGNLNNHIGVPLTLLKLKPHHEILILEMGANKIDDINELCNLSDPDEGLITNIGKAHLEGFGSQLGILKTKTELFDFIQDKNGIIYFNTNSPLLNTKKDLYKNLITYGEQPECQYPFVLKQEFPFIKFSFGLKGREFDFESKLFGSHNFENLMAAVCIGINHNISFDQIQFGINNYFPSNMRSQIINWKNATIILDAYNANPSSMKMAIESLIAFEGVRKWAILGEMAELGEYSQMEHEELVKLSSHPNIEKVVFVGEQFSQINHEQFVWFKNTLECKDWFINQNIDLAIILIKGSRSVGLEQLLTDELH